MIAKEALKLIKRSLGEHGWFGREETDCIEQAIKQQETLQAEYEALKKDLTRFLELDTMLYLQGWHSKEETIEYQELRTKLVKESNT